jgi:hypothetical protein
LPLGGKRRVGGRLRLSYKNIPPLLEKERGSGGEVNMEREETEAMWERIRALEKNNLEVAREAANLGVVSAYNLAVTMLVHFGEPKKIVSFTKYMEPRYESAEEAALGAPSIKEAFRIAADFHNDCMNYLKSLI